MILRIGSKDQRSGGRAQGAGQKTLFYLNPSPLSLNPGKGFTLIEVLLAVSLLAVGLVGVLRAYATSTSVMEKVQYDMDAAILLKTVMEQVEEKAITQGDIVPGVSSGKFVLTDTERFDVKDPGRWSWSQSVEKMIFSSKKVKQDPDLQEIRSDAEKEADFYLNKLKLTVVNSERIPPREVSLETYVRTESVKSSPG